MKSHKQAFTLIELLVVVLIIGILAAVALPQYQKAVEKSRATQALTLLKTLAISAETYYLANGTYPSNLDELDVTFPQDWTGTKGPANNGETKHSNNEWGVQLELPRFKSSIHITRISGKYQGGGFSYYLQPVLTAPTHEIICMEWKDLFKGSDGDYCQKLFNGTLKVSQGAGARMYQLP